MFPGKWAGVFGVAKVKQVSSLGLESAPALGTCEGWEGESGWGMHVNPWLIHVYGKNHYNTVISLQLIVWVFNTKC